MKQAMKRLENLKNYTEISIPWKNSIGFYKELEKELYTFVGTKKEIDEKISNLNLKSIEMFKENQRLRQNESREKTNQFKNDLALVNGIENHPKLNELWDKAWEHGHSSGLHDVKYYFEDLMELLS